MVAQAYLAIGSVGAASSMADGGRGGAAAVVEGRRTD